MMDDAILRTHLIKLLRGGDAHLTDEVFDRLPLKAWGERPPGAPHTLWQLLEHLRVAQWDILEFSRDPKHVSPPWPEGYWPTTDRPASAAALKKSVATFRAELREMEQLVKSPKTDLAAAIPWGDGQTILRETLVLADHNAYHLGQFVLVRRLVGHPPGK